ncbi:MAG: ATP-dependent RNA helicase HrpA [Marichromatium sp.]|nr:ATP-dependent RNA helicase HrpA [Marichromatium sp.]
MTEQSFPADSELERCLLQDRPTLGRRLKGLRRRARAGQPFERGLHALWQRLRASQALCERRGALVPAIDYPPALPVSERREELAALIREHQVVVVCGETGSGKSTQLPKLCLDLGRGRFGRIGHTQPRRIAARSLAARVAQELGGEVGALVGYKVRFHDRVRPETAIKLMTDGMLLAEVQQDRDLREYDTLIIDEAHERSLNIDFLLGYLRGVLARRPEFKLIVTSATIDPQRFADHFADAAGNPAPVIEISGRTYPVEVRYRPPESPHAGERDESMQRAISDAVGELAAQGPGDVLVFLSGEREIRETAETLRKHHPPSTEILPLFARQGPREQARVFQPHSTRRVVLATNVAETSLTVPGIRYVIDPGFARISRYSHRTKVQRLPVERISRASADQRKGRCGRVAEGICIRLYDEESFAERAAFTEPEIVRTNLAAVILQMKLLGFGAIERFPFIDPPDGRLVRDGYRTLEELAAIDAAGELTELGRRLARLPVDPRIGRMLLAGAERRCLREVLIIAAALSVQDPRERPHDQQQAADEIHATFAHEHSDFLGFVNLWTFLERERHALSRNKFTKLCQRHFLSPTRVQEWRDVHAQLREQMLEMGDKEDSTEGGEEQIHRALLSGLLGNIGFRDGQREYLGARNSRFHLHPSSGLFAQPPKWVVVAERVETTRQYGRTVARVQPAWIEEAGRHLLQRSYSEPHWQSRAGQVAAFERVTLFGVTLVARRRVNYGPINPGEAREIFLRFALVEGDFSTRAPFWRHNQALIEEIRALEAKSRRRDILVDEEAIYAFYAERVPSGIYSRPQFERWLREASRDNPKLLHMGRADLMCHDAAGVDAARFPDALAVGAARLPLAYHFEPGSDDDGLTLSVPVALLNQVSAERLEWLVPGLLGERIEALLRALPKSIRRSLVPIPDTAAQLVARLQPGDRPLLQALGEAIRAVKGVHVAEDAWDPTAVPEHLRMKIRVLGDEGATLAVDSDLARLRRRFAAHAEQGFADLPDPGLERDGLTRWDFEALPERVELERGGIRLSGFPALVDQGETVAVRVLDAEARAAAAHRHGVRRLFALHLGQELRQLRRQLPQLDRMRLQYAKAPQPESADGEEGARRLREADLAEALIARALDRTFLAEDDAPIRTRAAFEARLAERRGALAAETRAVCALAGEILDVYQRVRKTLAGINQINWMHAVLDIRAQLDALVFRGFLDAVAPERLRHYPRYLKAIEQRLDKLPLGAARDRQWMNEMAPLQSQWRERMEAARAAGRDDPRLDEIRWLLEELRVSLFAQQLGTDGPVSVKRIRARWRELGL